jgi:tungstate transport system ATP-binding protein
LSESLYEIDHLKHCYGNQPALWIESLTIPSASILGLIGPNGSGKSTFLKLLAFVERPTSGQIHFKGKPAAPFSDAVRFRVTLLTQEPYLMKRPVFDNVAYGLKIRGERHDRRERVYQALSWVGLDGEKFASRQWFELSGGEAQRVALAARLVLKPEVLLLDEPTASVDAASVQLIRDASLRARREWGTTLIIASHDWQWLYEICDNVRHLFRGHIFGKGMENIIFGPWQKNSGKNWKKMLQDGQYLVVSAPPNENAVAIIRPESVDICWPQKSSHDEETALYGTLSRLNFEKSTGHIMATIMIGNLSFTAKLTGQQLNDLRLCPGQKVQITYDPNAVTWHDHQTF